MECFEVGVSLLTEFKNKTVKLHDFVTRKTGEFTPINTFEPKCLILHNYCEKSHNLRILYSLSQGYFWVLKMHRPYILVSYKFFLVINQFLE